MFNYVDKEFKAVPPANDEHITFHVNIQGTLMHNVSIDTDHRKNN